MIKAIGKDEGRSGGLFSEDLRMQEKCAVTQSPPYLKKRLWSVLWHLHREMPSNFLDMQQSLDRVEIFHITIEFIAKFTISYGGSK